MGPEKFDLSLKAVKTFVFQVINTSNWRQWKISDFN
jgi:hypothetical protein